MRIRSTINVSLLTLCTAINFTASKGFANKVPTCAEISSIKTHEDLPHITIEQIMRESIETHPMTEKSLLAVQNALEDIQIARSARWPQLNAIYSKSHIHNPINTPTDGDLDSESFGLGLDFLVYDFGAQSLQVGAAIEREKRAEYSYNNETIKVALAAAEGYLDVLQQRVALDHVLAAYQDLKQLKLDLMNSKAASDADINKAWQSKESLCTQARVFLNEHNKAENFFNRVTNLEPEDYFLEETENILVDMNIESSIQSAINNHPSFSAVKTQILETQKLTAAAKRARLPVVNFNAATHDFEQPMGDFGVRNREGYTATVRITMPLFTGGKITSNINKAKRNERAAVLDQEDLMRSTKRLIKDLVQLLSTSEERLKELRGALNISENLYADYREKMISYDAAGNAHVNSQLVINAVEERIKLLKQRSEINALEYAIKMDRYTLVAQQGLLMGILNQP